MLEILKDYIEPLLCEVAPPGVGKFVIHVPHLVCLVECAMADMFVSLDNISP